MAKFCKYCGAQLEEGQTCTCPQAQAEAAQQAAPQQTAPQQAAPQQQYAPQAAPAAPSPVGAAFKNLVPFLKAYVASPVNATRAAVGQNDLILSIILLAIQAIVSGLVLFSFLAKVCGTVKDLVITVMGLTGGFSGGSLFGTGPSIDASFLMCLIYGILIAVVAIVIFALLVFAVAKIMKSNCTFKTALIACGANSLFVTALLVLTFLLFFLSIRIGIVLLIAALIAWVATGVISAQAITPATEQGKFWMLYIVAALITLLVAGFIGSKFFGGAVGATSISYAGESITISEALESAGDWDFEDLLEDVIYDLF